jgi:hypothetical protein
MPDPAKLYPGAFQSQRVQLGCPVEHYAGTYSHLGYGLITWTAELDNEGPYLCLKLARSWPGTYTIRHVNAEFWLGVSWHDISPLKSVFKAQTRVGVDGQSKAIGIAMESSMPDRLIWFTRI